MSVFSYTYIHARLNKDKTAFPQYIMRICTHIYIQLMYSHTYTQLNKDKTAFQRIFVQDVRKCDDMLRILRYLKELMGTVRSYAHVMYVNMCVRVCKSLCMRVYIGVCLCI